MNFEVLATVADDIEKDFDGVTTIELSVATLYGAVEVVVLTPEAYV